MDYPIREKAMISRYSEVPPDHSLRQQDKHEKASPSGEPQTANRFVAPVFDIVGSCPLQESRNR
jgi:hypothetical protein